MSEVQFDYDVFISFASGDQELVRPLWQELSAGGLRVFWSDSALRESVGTSWFEVIQHSLDRSQHLVVVFTSAALSSAWVKREYGAFYNQCYSPPSRRLVPVLAQGRKVADLPFLLREVEACRLDESGLSRRLLRLLGGIDVEALRAELAKSKHELARVAAERDATRSELAQLEESSQARYQQAANETSALRAELDSQQSNVRELATAKGEVDSLQLKLVQLQANVLSSNKRGAKEISALTVERDSLQSKVRELAAARVEADGVRSELAQLHASVLASNKRAKNEINAVRTERDSLQAKVRELEKGPANVAPVLTNDDSDLPRAHLAELRPQAEPIASSAVADAPTISADSMPSPNPQLRIRAARQPAAPRLTSAELHALEMQRRFHVRQSWVAGGLPLLIVGAILNTTLAITAEILDGREKDISVIVGVVTFMVVFPSLLWFAAAFIADEDQSVAWALVPAAAIVIIFVAIQGANGIFGGILTNGIGAIIGTVAARKLRGWS